MSGFYSEYVSIVDIPSDIWREVLQNWIPSRDVLKTLARMDVAVGSSIREVRAVWRAAQSIDWSSEVTMSHFGEISAGYWIFKWSCAQSDIVAQFLQWVNQRSIRIRAISYCGCSLTNLSSNRLPGTITELKMMRNCQTLSRSVEEWETLTKRYLLQPFRRLESWTVYPNHVNELNALHSIACEDRELFSSFRSLTVRIPVEWDKDSHFRLSKILLRVADRLSSLSLRGSNTPLELSPLKSSDHFARAFTCCSSLKVLWLEDLDIVDWELLNDIVQVISNNKTSLEEINVGVRITPGLVPYWNNSCVNQIYSLTMPTLKRFQIGNRIDMNCYFAAMTPLDMMDMVLQFVYRHPFLNIYNIEFGDSLSPRRVCRIVNYIDSFCRLYLGYDFDNTNAAAIFEAFSRWPHQIFKINAEGINTTKHHFDIPSSAICTSSMAFVNRHSSTLREVKLSWFTGHVYFPLDVVLASCLNIVEVYLYRVADCQIFTPLIESNDVDNSTSFSVKVFHANTISGDISGLLQRCTSLVKLTVENCDTLDDSIFPLLNRYCPELKTLFIYDCDNISAAILEKWCDTLKSKQIG